MIDITDATKNKYLGDSSDKQLVISLPNVNVTYTNDDIIQESLSIEEWIEKGNVLSFTGCFASQAKFTVAHIASDYRGQYCEISITADNTETIPLFKGYVDSQDNQTKEDIQTKFTCYDALYSMGGKDVQAWVDSLGTSMTVKQLRDSLFTYIGIEQENVSLICDNYSVNLTTFKSFCDNPTGVTVMQWICKLNGRFGQIGRDGKFHYRELLPISKGTYPSTETFPSLETYPSAENAGMIIDPDYYTQNGLEYEPYETAKITKVVIVDGGGISQGIAGTGDNALIIQDNPLASSVSMTSAARAILAKIDQLNYIPVKKFELRGLPWLECGDSLMSYTKRYTIRTFILHRVLSGIQSLMDSFESDGDQYRPDYKPTAITKINADRKTIIEIQADVAQFKDITAQNFTAVNGKIDNLSAIAITTQNLSAQNISADQITAGTLNVDRIQASSINASKLNVSAGGDNWSVGFRGGNSWFTTGALGATSITGSVSGGRNWKVDFGSYGSGGSFSIGTLDASSITTGTLSADRIDVNSLVSKFSSSTNFSAGTIRANQIYSNYITNAHVTGSFTTGNYGLKVGDYTATWKTVNVRLASGGVAYLYYLGH